MSRTVLEILVASESFPLFQFNFRNRAEMPNNTHLTSLLRLSVGALRSAAERLRHMATATGPNVRYRDIDGSTH
jgi:hypothetical protein